MRLAYERMSSEVPRQFIIIGTTNRTGNHLPDSTGNRRYGSVRGEKFDIEG